MSRFHVHALVVPLFALATWAGSVPAGAQGFRAEGATASFPQVSDLAARETPAIRRWKSEVSRRATAAGLRNLAEAYESAKLYQLAADTYFKEAAMRRRQGDVNAAKVEEDKANWWDSQVVLYREEEIRNVPRGPSLFEPASGCYAGAILTGDDRFKNDFEGFNRATGKHHPAFFDYHHYGRATRFPARWVSQLKAAGAAAQIAFEPNGGLATVNDDATLQAWARDAAASGVPIFLRYAAEMNGDWTAYGGKGREQEYIRKWRLVYSVMHRLAPNVALVWAPNSIPEYNIPDFYPGDAFVDWVGVNFYSVHHHNNMLDKPAEREDPADQLNGVYSRYAARKPVMICEYASTHYCKACGRSLPGFAADKMKMLYTSLPRRYPRVKGVFWYDIDNTSHRVRAGRDINNYSLTDNPQVLDAYKAAVKSPYFLEQVQTGRTQESGVRFPPLAAGSTLSGTVRLSASADTFSDRPVVGYRLDGKAQAALSSRPYEVSWDTTKVVNGPHALEALVFVDGRVATRQSWKIRIAN